MQSIPRRQWHHRFRHHLVTLLRYLQYFVIPTRLNTLASSTPTSEFVIVIDVGFPINVGFIRTSLLGPYADG